jgi:hypothetical protein
MIAAIKGKGVPRVKVTCDECQREEVVACDYTRQSGGDWLPNEGQARTKMQGRGWTDVKGMLRCASCEAKRKSDAALKAGQAELKQAKQAATVTPLREPTREQKREIVQMLEVAYDTEAQRYRGTDTDKTVAEALGGGVMPGWVADIREDLFGPDGGNDEMTALLSEVRDAKARMEKDATDARRCVETAQAALAKITEGVDCLSAYERRLTAIMEAVGPKARRA